jgi:phenylpropionate dioxygenase-like ring-hydroxylating dioxygenase large terminal subunit
MATARKVEAFDGSHARDLRGDPITGDRYYSKEFMEKEWDHMWTRVWVVGAVASELPEPGDYVVHNLRQESVILMRQEDGSVRAFYNTCMHRGNRLAWTHSGSGDGFSCSYHGWEFGVDGVLVHAQDADDFEGGDPCGQVQLSELRCDLWGGFVFYTMDDAAPTLLEFLDPIPDLLDKRGFEKMERVIWRTFEMDANWKFASDNFNESYHLPTVHPQLMANIDEDYKNTVFDMYPSGHNRMIEQGQPSLRSPNPNEVEAPWDGLLESWDLDPADFKGRARDGRVAMQQQMRKLGPERGYTHYDALTDSELTDPYHHTIFPNFTLTAGGDGFSVFITEPHPTDPEKCTFDYWYFAMPVEGQDEVGTIVGMRPMEAAEQETYDYGSGIPLPDMEGSFLIQDLTVAIGQQKGFHSRGYKDAILSGQESRIRRFHEVINDYIAGRR